MIANLINTYIIPYHLDIIATLAGLTFTIVGFAITIYNVIKSKRAAQEAADRAKNIGNVVFKIDKLAEIEKTLSLIEDIKRMNSTGEILIYPQIYSAARKSLINFRASFQDMHEDHKSVMQEFITSLSRCEIMIDKSKLDKSEIDSCKINKQLNSNLDSMYEILAALRIDIGRSI